MARQGVATVAELRAPRMATSVLSANADGLDATRSRGGDSDGEVSI